MCNRQSLKSTHSSGESNFQLLSYEADLKPLTGFGDGDDADSKKTKLTLFQIVSKQAASASQFARHRPSFSQPVIATLANQDQRRQRLPDIHAGVLLGHRDAGYGAVGQRLGLV